MKLEEVKYMEKKTTIKINIILSSSKQYNLDAG